MTALRHILSIIALPGIVTVVIPFLLLQITHTLGVGWSSRQPLPTALSLIGVLFIVCGLILGIRTVALFAFKGEGTLAPWDPPEKLVVQGVYRNVRNPMITGAISILLGEALLLGSLWIAGWAVLFAVGNFIYIPLSEEPGLEGRFGSDYTEYKENVPRWLPRLTPWEPPTGD